VTHTARRSAAFRRLVAGIATTAALIIGTALIPQAAMATTTTYTLSGQITYGAPGSTPPPTEVHVYALTGNGAELRADYTATSSGGAWSVPGVPAGRYRIEFAATTSDNGANAPIWYGGTPFEDQATVVTVNSNLSGLNETQVASGTISGMVTGSVDDVSTFRAYLWNPDTGLFELVKSVSRAGTGAGSYTISGLNPGEYLVRFADSDPLSPAFSTQYYNGSVDVYGSAPVTLTAGQAVTGIDGTVGAWGWYSGRISGPDRFQTATAVSSAFYSPGTANVVYIADGLSYPDALSASAAAAFQGGPLLLVSPTGVPSTVTTEIKRLQPPKIVVVGGTGAVSAGVYSALAKLVPAGGITRVFGADRYATSRAIASYAFGDVQDLGTRDSVFVATGANYPDALVAGSAAGYEGSPLILVNGTAPSLDTATSQLIATLDPLRAYVVGGAAVVSTGIQHALENLTSVESPSNTNTVLRLSGADRFLTAQAVNTQVFPFADSAYVATAYGFADALSISAIAGVVGAPLILSTYTCIPYDEFTHETSMGVSAYWLIGGTGVLSPSVENITYCSASASTAPSLESPSATPVAGPTAVAATTPAEAGLPALLQGARAKRP
jgi:Putative cell wall-binding domain